MFPHNCMSAASPVELALKRSLITGGSAHAAYKSDISKSHIQTSQETNALRVWLASLCWCKEAIWG